jgi:hypothetical protein
MQLVNQHFSLLKLKPSKNSNTTPFTNQNHHSRLEKSIARKCSPSTNWILSSPLFGSCWPSVWLTLFGWPKGLLLLSGFGWPKGFLFWPFLCAGFLFFDCFGFGWLRTKWSLKRRWLVFCEENEIYTECPKKLHIFQTKNSLGPPCCLNFFTRRIWNFLSWGTKRIF